MNAPLVIELARALAARPEVTAASSPESCVTALYRRVLARPPDPVELQAAVAFMGPRSDSAKIPEERSQLDPIQQFAQVLLMTNELMFVD